MSDKFELVEVAAVPLLRCSKLISSVSPLLCGRPAPWQGLSGPGGMPAFHCDAHRALVDAPIAAGVTFAQVLIECHVRFAAAESVAALAGAEAVQLLDLAVRNVGGLLDIDRSTRTRCRYTPEWRGRGDSASGSHR